MSANLNEGELITYAIDEIIDVFKGALTLTDMTQPYNPGSASLQRSSNQYWKPVQQQAVTYDGWDLGSVEGAPNGILELSVQGSLDEPANIYRVLRVDDLRDQTSYRRAVRADALRLRGQMEARGFEQVRKFGSYLDIYTVDFSSVISASTVTIWDAAANAAAKCLTQEFNTDAGSCIFFNPLDYVKGGQQAVQNIGRVNPNIPTDAYEQGKITEQLGGITEIYRHGKVGETLATTAGDVTVDLTAGTDIHYKPVSTTTLNGITSNVDNRFATVPVAVATAINVGDKFIITVAAITISSASSTYETGSIQQGGLMNALSLDEKVNTGQPQTFRTGRRRRHRRAGRAVRTDRAHPG